ncbi:MAG: hypothetical protein ABIJ18_02805 [archaeon]
MLLRKESALMVIAAFVGAMVSRVIDILAANLDISSWQGQLSLWGGFAVLIVVIMVAATLLLNQVDKRNL